MKKTIKYDRIEWEGSDAVLMLGEEEVDRVYAEELVVDYLDRMSAMSGAGVIYKAV